MPIRKKINKISETVLAEKKIGGPIDFTDPDDTSTETKLIKPRGSKKPQHTSHPDGMMYNHTISPKVRITKTSDDHKYGNRQESLSMSIFNEERKEYFLEHLQESMLHHAAIRDRAEKLAAHMGISIGEAANQLKAHLVQEAAKRRKGNPIDQSGMRSYDKGEDDLVPGRTKAERVQRVMTNIEKGRPKLPGSVKESFKEFIAEYESVLAENDIAEYDLDEATEYFIEEILPIRQKKIISEGIDLLLAEELTVESFIDWLEEGLGVLKKAGKDMMKNDLPNAIKSYADADKKFGAEHPLVKKLKAHVDHVVQTAANHQAAMKAAAA